jgi:hypothetical protein
VAVPGSLRVRASVPRGTAEHDVSLFIVLSHGTDQRRIPFWLRVERPRLGLEPKRALPHPGVYRASTADGVSRVSSYRYPEVPAGKTSFPVRLTGPEIVYRLRVRRRIANLGAAVVSRDPGVRVEPRIVRADDENRLAGYTALPFDQNPYRPSVLKHRLVVGVVRPAPGVYDIVFDTPRGARPGGFRFRYWLDDTTPPSIRVIGVRGRFLEVAVKDAGSGVDPLSVDARVDGDALPLSYASGLAHIPVAGLARGRHALTISAADYQETKNMENVAAVRPNTRVTQTTFVLR